jgi:hypothetical protein
MCTCAFPPAIIERYSQQFNPLLPIASQCMLLGTGWQPATAPSLPVHCANGFAAIYVNNFMAIKGHCV